MVVVDAIQTGQHPPGTVHALPLEALHSPAGPSPHGVGLPSALARTRSMAVFTSPSSTVRSTPSSVFR